MERQLHQPPAEQPPALPTSEQLLNRPAEHVQQLYQAKLSELELQLSVLETQAAELRAQIASGNIMPDDPYAAYQRATKERELVHKTTSLDLLDSLQLPDSGTETATYSIYHDLESAASYTEIRTVRITHSDGAYYIVEHRSHDKQDSNYEMHRRVSDNRDCMAAHRQLKQPLSGKLTSDDIRLDALHPLNWSALQGNIQQAVEDIGKNPHG